MFGFSVLFTALLPLLASAAPSGVGFTKRIDANAPVLEKKYDLNPWYTALRPMPTYTINRWTWTIPNKCYDEAIGNALKNGWTGRCTDVNKLSVFEVTYSDASKPWMFCRCTDSGESEADMIEKVGRIPAGIRQHTRYIMAFKGGPENAGIGATVTWEGDLIMYGSKDIGTYLHEMAHQVDIRSGNDGLYPMYSFEYSSRASYEAAAAKDTCFVSNYAKSSYKSNYYNGHVEHWADVFVFVQYIMTIPYEYGLLPTWAGCAVNSVYAILGDVYEKTKNYSASVHLPYGEYTIKRNALPVIAASVDELKPVTEIKEYAIHDYE